MKANLILVCLVSALLLSYAPTGMSVTCNVGQLTPCYGPIFNGVPPSPTCCANLKAQRPCFCQYLKDPSLGPLINSPNGRKLATNCKVPFPRC